MNIRQLLDRQKLIADGSFGTYYAERYQTDEAPELANVLHEDRVARIHGAYIKAGAKLIRTNTFASNTAFLNCDINGVKNNIIKAIELAKAAVAQYRDNNENAAVNEDKINEAVSDEIFIAGDIGPIPMSDGMDANAVENEYYEIAKTFIACGINIINFETFSELDRILPVIKHLKSEYGRNDDGLFVMVQFSVNQFGYSGHGLSAGKLLMMASAEADIDAIGLNCGVGPGHMQQVFERSRVVTDKYIIVLPNAGYPKRIRNRITFGENSDYFADKLSEIAGLGVDIVGGCCGTNPEFIAKLKGNVSLEKQPRVNVFDGDKALTVNVIKKGFMYDDAGNLKTGRKLIAVELAPPLDANDEKILAAAYSLKNAGVDVLTFPDSPSGRTRIDSVLMAEKVKRETGMNVMPHICCRDKNAIAMRSTFLGAHINDIHNLLIITGDPIPSMARQTVKAVFNFDSIGLMNIAKDMNEEIFAESPLSFGGAINQNRRNIEIEIERVRRKIQAGAEFFLTQPVFTMESADVLRRIKKETNATIMCGIMPFVSRKNALFMKNEIAGIHVTDDIIARYPENATKEEGESVGIEIAKEVMRFTEDFADGYYFSFPFNRVHMLNEILK